MNPGCVLIVEDDAAICALLQALLQRHGFASEVVGNGEEAIGQLRRHNYIAVLLDIMLPGAFGFDVIRFLGAERPWMLPRVIVMTAASQSMLRDFDTSPIRALLHKPFDIGEMLEHVVACAELDKSVARRATSPAPI